MSDYRGVDYYGIEALLSEEQRMVRDAVRDWVEKEFVPSAASDLPSPITAPTPAPWPRAPSRRATSTC